MCYKLNHLIHSFQSKYLNLHKLFYKLTDESGTDLRSRGSLRVHHGSWEVYRRRWSAVFTHPVHEHRQLRLANLNRNYSSSEKY